MTKIAELKHDILQGIMLSEECAYDHDCPDYIYNALRRIYYLALLCNDAGKLQAIYDLQQKVLKKP